MFGTEDEHQLRLDVPVAMHVAHRLHITLFTLLEFCLKGVELVVEHVDIPVETGDVLTDGVDGTTLVCNLVVDDHEVLQTFLHVALIGLQLALLFLDLLTHLGLLVLQGFDRRSRSLLSRFPGCS